MNSIDHPNTVVPITAVQIRINCAMPVANRAQITATIPISFNMVRSFVAMCVVYDLYTKLSTKLGVVFLQQFPTFVNDQSHVGHTLFQVIDQ